MSTEHDRASMSNSQTQTKRKKEESKSDDESSCSSESDSDEDDDRKDAVEENIDHIALIENMRKSKTIRIRRAVAKKFLKGWSSDFVVSIAVRLILMIDWEAYINNKESKKKSKKHETLDSDAE